MALTRRTFTVSGRIIGEWQSGQRTDHLSDALGSVTAITSSSGSVSTTVRYRPYGSLLSTTGSPNLRPFSWIGMTGYRRNDNHAFSDTYVRARHYDSIIGAWTSVDQLWPREQPYTYVHSRPVRFIDPDGQASIDPQCHAALARGTTIICSVLWTVSAPPCAMEVLFVDAFWIVRDGQASRRVCPASKRCVGRTT